MPALQLQFGTRLVIDSDPPVSRTYFTCTSFFSCTADYEATPELVARLKTGQTLQIQAVNLAAKAVTLSLSDASGKSFRTASEGPAFTDPGVFERQQKRLQAYAQTLPGAPVQGASSYSPWEKLCSNGRDPNAKEVCYTGKQGRNAAGQLVVAAALIDRRSRQEGVPRYAAQPAAAPAWRPLDH